MIHGWLQPFFLVVGSFVDLLWKTMAQVHLLLYNKNILTNDNNYIYIHDIVIYIYIYTVRDITPARFILLFKAPVFPFKKTQKGSTSLPLSLLEILLQWRELTTVRDEKNSNRRWTVAS